MNSVTPMGVAETPRSAMTVERVSITPAAAELVRKLRDLHGDLMFHQSGGCCDGSAPMCYPKDEFKVGGQDILLGQIEGCPFYMGAAQFNYWKHTQLMIDVVPGRGSGFSLEAPEGLRFLTRSRLFSEEETAELASKAAPAPPFGQEERS